MIESVFQKLGSSYPNDKTPPELAPEQMRQSLLSMYRINRAMTNLNIKDFQLTKESGQKDFIKRVVEETKNIELSPEEQKVFDEFAGKILKPVNDFNRKLAIQKEIKRRGLDKGKK
jgi:hypothetical protein